MGVSCGVVDNTLVLQLVLANGPGEQGSIPGCVIPKTLK